MTAEAVVTETFPLTFTELKKLIGVVMDRNSSSSFGGERYPYNITNSGFTHKAYNGWSFSYTAEGY